MQILFLEDDAIIASGLLYALEKEGYSVTCAKSVAEGAKVAQGGNFDIAILDIGLPDGLGFEITADLKRAGTSLIFLTAVDDEGNIIRAFEDGAEDYVTKPFRLGELLARIRAVSRRREGGANTLGFGRVSINLSQGLAYVGGSPLDLTALEYRLLLTFATHKAQVLSRAQILNLIWDSEGVFVEDNTLTVYIKRLREKLGDAAKIETVRGMGYRAHDN